MHHYKSHQNLVTNPPLNHRKPTGIGVQYFLYWKVTGAVFMHVLCGVYSVLLRNTCFQLPLLAISGLFFGTNLLPKTGSLDFKILMARFWGTMVRYDTLWYGSDLPNDHIKSLTSMSRYSIPGYLRRDSLLRILVSWCQRLSYLTKQQTNKDKWVF